jgi:tRNA(Ile)-lysidine synthetase-like protein
MANYPKSGPVAGTLIRNVLSFWRENLGPSQISSHILIAVSGGVDSMALAELVIKYGRKVADPRKIRIIHINHRWRKEESDADETFVRKAAREWKVPITIVRLKAPSAQTSGESLEDRARKARKRIFKRLSEKYQAPVLTAHHADDLAETLIWRLMTGTATTHGAGISFQSGVELRPLLKIRKKVLKEFLIEAGKSWREDRTNFEGRFLRSRLRSTAMPALEALFPRMVERLVEQGLNAQKRPLGGSNPSETDPSLLFSAAGLELRRAHFDILEKLKRRVEAGESKRGEWNFERGWKLKWESTAQVQRWILERS